MDQGSPAAAAPALSRRQLVLFSLAATAIGLLICGLLAEGALRFLGRRPAYLDPAMYIPLPDGRTYGLRPGFVGLYSGGRVHVGPLGLRQNAARPRAIVEMAGGVLVLGDSADFGQGLDDEQTLAAQAEGMLRGQGVPVINAGVPGYNTVTELAQLRALLPVLRPRLVVLAYVLDNDTDLRPGVWVAPDGSLDFHLNQTLLGRLSRLATRHSVLYSQARGLFLVRQQALAPDTTAPFSPDYAGWQRSQQALIAMRDLLRQAGVPFAVGTIGLVQNLDALPVVQGFLRGQGIRAGVLWQTRDVADYVHRYAVSPTDSHANAAATRKAAAALVALIDNREGQP